MAQKSYYYRPQILALKLGGTEEAIQNLIAQIQNAYDFLERDVKENFPQYYEGDLENAAREQISEANKKIEELYNFIQKESHKFGNEGTKSQFIYELDNKYLEPLRATIQGNVVGGFDPSMKERWGDVFEGEKWNEAFNPIRSIQMKYQDFGLGPGMGYKPKEKSDLGWNLATAALGFIPGVGIPLAATVGAINRGTDKGANLGDWLKGGVIGGISGWGASKLGQAISNILPAGMSSVPMATPLTGGPLQTYANAGSVLAQNIANQGSNLTNLLPGITGGSTMPLSISGQPVSNFMNNLSIGGQPYDIRAAGNLLMGGQPYMDYNALIQNIGAGMPSSSADLANWLLQQQILGTPGGFTNIPTGMPNLITSGGDGFNMGDALRQLFGGGNSPGQNQNNGNFDLNSLLNSFGIRTTEPGLLEKFLPLAALIYLNQKDYEMPQVPEFTFPSWMEQVRTGAMQPQEYDIASQKLQQLMGLTTTPFQYPMEEIKRALQAQQDIQREQYEKYINPILASQGQYDSTYRANLLGDYLKGQQAQSYQTIADLLTNQALQNYNLQQWLPQFQANVTGQLGNLGGQRAQTGQGWFGEGLRYGALANAPSMVGYETELNKILNRQAQDQQLATLMGMMAGSAWFPQNPVFNPNWGMSQPSMQTQKQSTWDKLLGYGNTATNLYNTGSNLWNIGSKALSWF